jgi:hypothetical protein
VCSGLLKSPEYFSIQSNWQLRLTMTLWMLRCHSHAHGVLDIQQECSVFLSMV